MKTKDRIKEEIGLYKLLLTLDFAMATSLASWLWSNFVQFNIVVKIAILFTLFVLIIFGGYLLMLTWSKIKELDYE